MSDRHRLLRRQLRRCFGDRPIPPEWEPFLGMVERAYQESDRHRQLLERSLELTSNELLERNSRLQEDLRARFEAEAALRASEAQLRATLAGLPDSIYVIEPSGVLVAAHVTHPLLPTVEIGQDLFAAIPLDRRTAAQREAQEAFATGEVVEASFVREGRRIEVRFVPYHGQYVTIILRDVTEQDALEQQVIMAERMATIGTLAAGVAHEINNPLTYLLGNLSFARNELERHDGDEELIDALSEAEMGAKRVRKIVADLRALSGGSNNKTLAAVDVGRALDAASSIAQVEIQRRARLELELENTPCVEADESQLGQVLLNLLVNAAQALPESQRDAHVIRVRSRVRDHEVDIEVVDDGPGIPNAVAARLFEPFFTTKELGEGTGLGLAISRRLIEGFGGRLEHIPTEVGACFRITLRRAANSRTTTPDPPDAAYASGVVVTVPARVLVIDDEVDLGRAIRRLLNGHHVTLTTGGRDGLRHLLEGDFDIAFCDLVMPDITGVEIHSHLLEFAPHLLERVVFMTGGAATASARDFLERAEVPVMEKPFEATRLHRHVERAVRTRLRRERQRGQTG